MANEKLACNQMCRWNNPSDGCVKPTHATCPLSNSEPDASGWGQVQENKKRLIDANVVRHKINAFAASVVYRGNAEMFNGKDTCNQHEYTRGYERGILDAQKIVCGQDAVDAVEVVRCKDCKHCKVCYPEKQIGKEATQGWYCKEHKSYRKPDDFCSYGERRNNG